MARLPPPVFKVAICKGPRQDKTNRSGDRHWSFLGDLLCLHPYTPGKLMWNPKMEVWKMMFLFKGSDFMIIPPLQMKYWGGGVPSKFLWNISFGTWNSPPPTYISPVAADVGGGVAEVKFLDFSKTGYCKSIIQGCFHWFVLTCLNHKPCQLEIGGHCLHESLSTLWEIQVFGFQGSMVAMLKHAETKQGWCRCGSHSGIGSVGERWAYLGHWYLTVRGQRWNSWICQRMSKTGYCKSICQGCFQFHWLRTKVRWSKTIRYHQVSSGPLMHLVM